MFGREGEGQTGLICAHAIAYKTKVKITVVAFDNDLTIGRRKSLEARLGPINFFALGSDKMLHVYARKQERASGRVRCTCVD